MSETSDNVAGFYAPVHRALSDPILLGGAPRTDLLGAVRVEAPLTPHARQAVTRT